jgi:[ribosomal protein S18]-alanine N-acetyltransferase
MTTASVDRHDPSPEGIEVEITPMRRRHLRAVLRIESHNPHRPWSLGLFMSELALRGSRVYAVARVSNVVVGFAGIMFSGADAHVTTIAVDPAWRRRGVATRLMLVMARQAIERQAEAMTLEVRVSNDAAIALYERFGFKVAGTRKNYYSDLKEDAAVMWATEIRDAEYRQRLARLDQEAPGSTVLEGWT